MHHLFEQVLGEKDLSRAGELFSLEDAQIIGDLPKVLSIILGIIERDQFLSSVNEQSVVEIVITRVTSAIRDTGSIEQHADSLVSLLDACLQYDLTPSSRDHDPPHAKIASDLLACIFLNYDKRSVMLSAIPVAIRLLHKGNRDVCRNLAAYLSLVAIETAELLADYVITIVDSIAAGNHQLTQVLPPIYRLQPERVSPHIGVLLQTLPLCSGQEQLSLLDLFQTVAKRQPRLLMAAVPRLCELLCAPGPSAAAAARILTSMAQASPSPLAPHLNRLMSTVDHRPSALCQLLPALSAYAQRAEKVVARDVLVCVLSRAGDAGLSLHALSGEVSRLSAVHPGLLPASLLRGVEQQHDTATAASTLLLYLSTEQSNRRLSDDNCVTVVRVGGSSGGSRELRAASSRDLFVSSRDHLLRGRLAGDSSRSTPRLNQSRTTVIGATSASLLGLQRHTDRHHHHHHPHTGHHGNTTGAPHHFSRSSVVLNGGGRPVSMYHTSTAAATSAVTVPMTPAIAAVDVPVDREPLEDRLLLSSVGAVRLAGSPPAGSPSSTEQLLVMAAEQAAGGVAASSMAAVVHVNSVTTGQQVDLNGLHSTSVSVRTLSDEVSSSAVDCTARSVLSGTTPSSFCLSSTPGDSGTAVRTITAAASRTRRKRRSPAATQTAVTTCASPDHVRSTPSTPQQRRSTISTASPNTNGNGQASSGAVVTSKSAAVASQRISVFEPYQMRDTMQHFCEKHLDKIKDYMQKVVVRLPLPVKCTIEERKSRKMAKLHFACQIHGEYCLYSKSFYPMKTKNPRVWIHLMFLTLQSRSTSAMSSRDPGPNSLKNCWDTLRWEPTSFLEVVTGCFPNAKETEILLQELRSSRFFDVFEYNGMECKWACFLCNHPEKAEGFVKPDQPVMEGQLKEKRGRWKMFRRWRTRYFTLSGAHLSYRCAQQSPEQLQLGQLHSGLDSHEIGVHEIQSVKVNRTARSIPKAFEIFTHDRTYVLKAKDGKQTEEWVRCLSVAVAHQNNRPRSTDSVSLSVNSASNLHSVSHLATL